MQTDPLNPDSAKTSNTAGIVAMGVVIIVVVFIAFLLLRNADHSDMNMETETETDTVSALSATQETSVPVAADNDTVAINMEAGNFYYSVKEIKVKEGQKIKVTVTAKDMTHDFNIDELGVKSGAIKDGDTGTIEFVASKKGSFEYYCSIGNGYHRKMGQVGKIIVE